MDLFAPGAPWTQAAAHVSVFKFYTQPISGNQYGRFSDSQLQQMFSFLKQHNIAIALEFGPLIATQGCGFINGAGDPVEGFEGNAQTIVNRIKANGGTLDYLVMDEPFYNGNLYSGPGACKWSAQQIATNALTNLNILKAAFPGMVIGDEEPMSGNGQAADWLQRYTTWMDTFEAVTGSKLAFFVGISSWMSDIASVRSQTSQRGILFGVIYNGLYADSSDAQWTTHAQEFLTEFELSNTQPDQAIFQSWVAFPLIACPRRHPTRSPG